MLTLYDLCTIKIFLKVFTEKVRSLEEALSTKHNEVCVFLYMFMLLHLINLDYIPINDRRT